MRSFGEKVKDNLRNGNIRMIFAADDIPDELRRIVEFLNGQMEPAEVLAVSIKQYADQKGDVRTIVPRVFGKTAQKDVIGSRSVRTWEKLEQEATEKGIGESTRALLMQQMNSYTKANRFWPYLLCKNAG